MLMTQSFKKQESLFNKIFLISILLCCIGGLAWMFVSSYTAYKKEISGPYVCHERGFHNATELWQVYDICREPRHLAIDDAGAVVCNCSNDAGK